MRRPARPTGRVRRGYDSGVRMRWEAYACLLLVSELPVKSGFYEQVTDVKWFLSFPS